MNQTPKTTPSAWTPSKIALKAKEESSSAKAGERDPAQEEVVERIE